MQNEDAETLQLFLEQSFCGKRNQTEFTVTHLKVVPWVAQNEKTNQIKFWFALHEAPEKPSVPSGRA